MQWIFDNLGPALGGTLGLGWMAWLTRRSYQGAQERALVKQKLNEVIANQRESDEKNDRDHREVKADLAATREDVAAIRGILEGMARRP